MPDIIAQATQLVAQHSCENQSSDGFLDKEKTILSVSAKWYVSKERAAKLCSYSSADAIHNKARRENWKSIEQQMRGGLKKFYAVESLPQPAQIKFHQEIKSKLGPRDDDAVTNAYQRASEKMRRRADQRLEILKSYRYYIEQSARRNKTKATKDFVAFWNVTHHDKKISRAQLYRWDAAERSEGISGLVDKCTRKPNHVAEWSTEAKAYIESLWLDESQRNIYSCYQNMKFMAKINGWKIPHPATCRRHLLKLSRDVVKLLREGKKAFTDKAYPSIQRDPNSIEVGQLYVADDRLADVSFGEGRQGDRLWTTVWMDVRSRKALSVVFTYKGNNTQAVLDGFYQAAQLHICEEVYFDNGGNYREAGFVNADQELMPKHLQAPFTQLFGEEKIHWALPGNARAKVVERAFLEMARIHDKNNPGYTGMNVLKRPEGWYLRRAEGNFMTPQEITRNISRFFFEIWNNWSADGRPSPNQVWEAHFSKHTYKRAEPEYLRNLLLRTFPKPIKIRARGVQFGKMCNGACADSGKRCYCMDRFYWDDSIQLLTGGIKEVWVKYSDFDDKRIWIYKLDGTPIGEVPCYNWNAVPYLRAGKQVGEYISKRKRREKEIIAVKDRLQDIHKINLQDADTLMNRADILPEPEVSVNKQTGEVIEKIEDFKPAAGQLVEPPPSIKQLRKRGKKIKKSIDHIDDLLSKIQSPGAADGQKAWDKIDGMI